MSRQTSTPSRPGSITSSSTRSGWFSRNDASALSPYAHQKGSKPSLRRTIDSISARAASSSTTRMRGRAALVSADSEEPPATPSNTHSPFVAGTSGALRRVPTGVVTSYASRPLPTVTAEQARGGRPARRRPIGPAGVDGSVHVGVVDPGREDGDRGPLAAQHRPPQVERGDPEDVAGLGRDRRATCPRRSRTPAGPTPTRRSRRRSAGRRTRPGRSRRGCPGGAGRRRRRAGASRAAPPPARAPGRGRSHRWARPGRRGRAAAARRRRRPSRAAPSRAWSATAR